MFRLETFPARDGDCLILAWGEPDAPKRMMIDGGREGCWPYVKAAILALPEAERVFELLVVTHIDADHIAGVLKMLDDADRPVTFKEVWFNGYHHLRPYAELEDFGPSQGDKLSKHLLGTPQLWNRAFDHNAVVVADQASPPRVQLEGGLELVLVSPTPEKLTHLETEWREWIEAEKLKPGAVIAPDPPKPPEYPPGFETFGVLPDVASLAAAPLPRDTEPPNGSSIAFIARYEDRRILLTGDAHADVSEAALGNLSAEERAFDLVKLSHHGSKANLSSGLAAVWSCRRFLICTDGSRHHHPDAQTIAHLIAAQPGPKTFYFNHRHEEAAVWDAATLKRVHHYDAVYPTQLGQLTIDIAALPATD